MSTARRRLLALAAVVLVVGGVAPAGVGAAQSAGGSISDVGWWTSNPAAEAPEGGLAVAAGLSGTTSLGAVRVVLQVDRVNTAVLALPEDGGLQTSGAPLRVCPTPNAWSAGPKQEMPAAPKAECDRAEAPLARGDDGTWSADVSTLLVTTDDRDEVSLMIVPAGAGSVPVGFEVRFGPPTIDVQGTSDDDEGDAFDSSERTSGGSDDVGGSVSSSPGSEDSFSSSFDSPSSSAAPPSPSISDDRLAVSFDTGPTAADTAAAGAVTSVGDSEPVASMPRAVLAGGRGSRYGQGLFFVLVSLAVGVAVGFGHARLRPGDELMG